MIRSALLFTTALLALAPVAHAAPETGARVRAAQGALLRATTFMRSLAIEGGYVDKISPTDLTRRTAEKPVRPSQIGIQPPGTPSMGMAFLRAYEATRAPIYLEAARDAAEALARCQLGSGGWNRTADFDPARPNIDGRLYVTGNLKFGQIIQHTLYTTFDDDTTQSAVRFLIAIGAATKDSNDPRDTRIAAARDRALSGMLRAQYPNGAWPQRYRGKPRDPTRHPVKKAHVPERYLREWPDADYTVFYPMNDNVQSRCIDTMLLAYRTLGRSECLESAYRCANFLLLAQLPEPHRGWAQQYDHNMEPAWARHMEPPSVCSAESSQIVIVLLDMYLESGERKFFTAAAAGVEWLKRSAIAPNRWARMYELGTNRPIYGDTDGKIHYAPPSRTGYGWESAFKVPVAFARYAEIEKKGRDAVLAEKKKAVDIRSLETRVDQAIASLDREGRWITQASYRKGDPLEDFITTKAYIQNATTLAEYLSEMNASAQRSHQGE